MTTKPLVYLDACCFIDAVKEQIGALPQERANDAWFVKKLLEAHRNGDVRLITSFLSVAECLAVDSGQVDVPVDVQARYKALLTSGQYVVLAPPTPRTGQVVQNLRWKHGIVVKGADGLHIATAIDRGAVEFITSDNKLKSEKMAAAILKLPAGSPRMIRASATASLPSEYLQERLGDGRG